MEADATTLTEKMRAALRISSTSAKITEEIEDCIGACKADLANDGVKVIDESDKLIIRAITLYCKAEFGYNDKGEMFRQSYDTLKMRLALSQEYNEEPAPPVSKTDTGTEGAESEA
ncbi:MAG: DNA-packaging protein [Lachnospiraceae bacterium]|nr:DNA-packaging protein [Lachnospiraceae bacterium]